MAVEAAGEPRSVKVTVGVGNTLWLAACGGGGVIGSVQQPSAVLLLRC